MQAGVPTFFVPIVPCIAFGFGSKPLMVGGYRLGLLATYGTWLGSSGFGHRVICHGFGSNLRNLLRKADAIFSRPRVRDYNNKRPPGI